jgi:5-methylthioadenosine/S-adenosylhomocysteine deaminase
VPFLREWVDPWLAHRRPDQLVAAYRLSLLEMARCGTTTFLSPNVDPGDDLDALFSVITQAGLRAILGRWVTPGALDTAVSAVSRGGPDVVDLWFGLMVPRQGEPEYVPEFYSEVAAAARDLGVGIVYHFCSEVDDAEYYQSTFGMAPLEWASRHGVLGSNVVLINGCWISPGEIALAAATGTSVVFSPTATMKMATGVTPVPALLGAGVNVALGTDGGANNNSHDMFQEMKMGCLIQNATHRRAGTLTAEQVLEFATLGGAHAVGRSTELGSLEPGKRADVVLVDLDRAHTSPLIDIVSNLVYAAKSSDVHTVLVDGRVIVRDRVVLTMDEAAVLASARTAAADIAGRITPAHHARWPME